MAVTGRLTLSWIGKDQALLGTAAGGYEWVEREDPRVAEVRLLHEAANFGEVKPGVEASDNLLIIGDSYDALRSLTRIPEEIQPRHTAKRALFTGWRHRNWTGIDTA